MQDPVRIAAALLVILQTALVAAIAVRGLNAKRGGIAAEPEIPDVRPLMPFSR